VARFPSSPGFELLGDANAMVGDTVQAVEAYQRSLELDPSNRNAAKRIRRLRGRQGTPNEGEMGALRDTP
jgi:cytochrome c-type biogenesis protein CcmH/NrfG